MIGKLWRYARGSGGKGFGRVFKRDGRDAAYSMARTLAAEPPAVLPLPQRRTWRIDRRYQLDQGPNPWCVAATGMHWERSTPVGTAPAMLMYMLYQFCKDIDGDANPGTTARSLMRVYKQRAQVEAYVWADDLKTLTTWILARGPVMFGTWWTTGMSRPSLTTGYIEPTGSIQGGHEVLLMGYDAGKKTTTILNSWGSSYGRDGRAFVHDDVLGELLRNDGDAVAASQIRGPR